MLILSPTVQQFGYTAAKAWAYVATSPSIPSKGAEGKQLHSREVEEFLLPAPLLHLCSHGSAGLKSRTLVHQRG